MYTSPHSCLSKVELFQDFQMIHSACSIVFSCSYSLYLGDLSFSHLISTQKLFFVIIWSIDLAEKTLVQRFMGGLILLIDLSFKLYKSNKKYSSTFPCIWPFLPMGNLPPPSAEFLLCL